MIKNRGISALFIGLLGVMIMSCKSAPKTAKDIDLNDFNQKISFALGADMGDMAATFSNIPEELFEEFNKIDMEDGFYAFLIDTTNSIESAADILSKALASASYIDTSTYNLAHVSYNYGGFFGAMLYRSLSSKNALEEVDNEIVRIGFNNSLLGTDTLLVSLKERQKMIIDFNNDMNKRNEKVYMDKKRSQYPDNIQDGGYILVEKSPGSGTPIDLAKEYKISYTLVNMSGDTLVSTYKDLNLSVDENTEVFNAEDIIFPEGWRIATETGKMTIGGKYVLFVPADLAYGENGLPSPGSSSYVIQPYSAVEIHSQVFEQAERNSFILNKGKKIIEEAKKRPNTVVDKSGFILTTLVQGIGEQVQQGWDVQANYKLTNSSGEEIENSFLGEMSGRPAPSFSLESVINGWKLAIPKMKVGGRYILTLPYDLAYGESGNYSIAPFETLTFEIEVINTGKPGSLVQRTQGGGHGF